MSRVAVLLVTALLVAGCTEGPGSAGGEPTTTPSGGPTNPGSSGTGITCWTAPPGDGDEGITLVDVTADAGLVEPLLGLKGHSAAWGDIDHDGLPDLAVGTFATARGDVYLERGATGPSPDRILRNDQGFSLEESVPDLLGRTSGLVFVDLDVDGDEDLVLSRNVVTDQPGDPTQILEQTDAGWQIADSGIDPSLGGRSVGVLDVDSDGLLDLLIVVDRYRGGNSRLYRNEGDLRFTDMTVDWGLGDGVEGLGIATGDLDGDGLTDVFIAGSNRMFLGTGDGLAEVDPGISPWETFGNEDDVAGAAIADVNRDGRLDLVVGQHYNSTLSRGTQVPVRLYLNQTPAPGSVELIDATEESGLTPLPTKAPHVEFVDIDNDGLVDILTTASAGEGSIPAIFRNTGLSGGVPQFETPSGLGSAQYWVSGPSADYDRDGRLDLFLVEWEPALPSLLMRNETSSGHWIEVSVGPELGGGVGTRVDVYEAGQAGVEEGLLGSREIVASVGYSAGVERFAHFGLGEISSVDIVVTPPQHAPIILSSMPADQHLRLPDGCG